MAIFQAPLPVKLIVAVLYSDESRLLEAGERLVQQFGPSDFTSQKFPFTVTDYYVPEMGSPIFRLFYAFEKLVSPGDLANIKRATHAIENELAVNSQRKVNLDPGYLDTDKFVLASAKYNGQKIYLADGIWADLTLHYEKGHFSAYPWSFPDFRSGEYEKTFLRIREIYKGQLKRIFWAQRYGSSERSIGCAFQTTRKRSHVRAVNIHFGSANFAGADYSVEF